MCNCMSRFGVLMLVVGGIGILAAVQLPAAERTIDPTFLRRSLADREEKPIDVTTPTCHYQPIFGLGDSESRIVRGIARFGQVTIDPKGQSAETTCAGEEQVYLVLEGSGNLSYGDQQAAVVKDDFMYLAPGVRRSLANPGDTPCRVIAMGFRVPGRADSSPLTPDPSPARGEGSLETASKLLKASLADVKKQVVFLPLELHRRVLRQFRARIAGENPGRAFTVSLRQTLI